MQEGRKQSVPIVNDFDSCSKRFSNKMWSPFVNPYFYLRTTVIFIILLQTLFVIFLLDKNSRILNFLKEKIMFEKWKNN